MFRELPRYTEIKLSFFIYLLAIIIFTVPVLAQENTYTATEMLEILNAGTFPEGVSFSPPDLATMRLGLQGHFPEMLYTVEGDRAVENPVSLDNAVFSWNEDGRLMGEVTLASGEKITLVHFGQSGWAKEEVVTDLMKVYLDLDQTKGEKSISRWPVVQIRTYTDLETFVNESGIERAVVPVGFDISTLPRGEGNNPLIAENPMDGAAAIDALAITSFAMMYNNTTHPTADQLFELRDLIQNGGANDLFVDLPNIGRWYISKGVAYVNDPNLQSRLGTAQSISPEGQLVLYSAHPQLDGWIVNSNLQANFDEILSSYGLNGTMDSGDGYDLFEMTQKTIMPIVEDCYQGRACIFKPLQSMRRGTAGLVETETYGS